MNTISYIYRDISTVASFTCSRTHFALSSVNLTCPGSTYSTCTRIIHHMIRIHACKLNSTYQLHSTTITITLCIIMQEFDPGHTNHVYITSEGYPSVCFRAPSPHSPSPSPHSPSPSLPSYHLQSIIAPLHCFTVLLQTIVCLST